MTIDQAADAADAVLLGQPGDLGVDGLGDLLGDQAAGVEREIAEQEAANSANTIR